MDMNEKSENFESVNLVKKKLLKGEIVLGIGVIRCVEVIEICQSIADAGYDFAFIDMEHTQYSLETISRFVNKCRQVDVEPWVRVLDSLRTYVSRVLDAGATGVIIPRVENRTQVEEIIKYVGFPPASDRGFGGG